MKNPRLPASRRLVLLNDPAIQALMGPHDTQVASYSHATKGVTTVVACKHLLSDPFFNCGVIPIERRRLYVIEATRGPRGVTAKVTHQKLRAVELIAALLKVTRGRTA